ncbi:hypothetical protein RMATCC62417_11970 [Rhizopus microsporus]|nr:hypothetical protein RMATCC62417_11970 [Rhizopus microsporus]
MQKRDTTLVIIAICASLAAIGFAAPAPQAGPGPFEPHPPGGTVADPLDDFADMQTEGSTPIIDESVLRKRRFSRNLLKKIAKNAAARARKFGKLPAPPSV